ncbi:MAG: DUF1016 domain-containing protein [Bacteroidetes bacterium]|nr:MAG: DUF1016 domain-containing protein [Bacteroidota bacterium]
MKKSKRHKAIKPYNKLLGDVASLLEAARRQSARQVNALMTATYWLIGWRIVEFEQAGEVRAEYGEQLLEQLSADLTRQFGRGFSIRNIRSFRMFYLQFQIRQTVSAESEKLQTPSAKSYSLKIRQTVSGKSEMLFRKFNLVSLAQSFPLSWSHYVRLLPVENPDAREFYETEALRGGWSVRQLDRQIATQFYERTTLSKDKAAMLKKGKKQKPEDILTAEEEIKDPFVLEFLGLKDEYSENDLEEALVHHLEQFLLELGGDFTFVGRQKRLRIGSEWYKIDLLFFHRTLRCLVIIDLKVGKFTHADAGQMHLYLNYAREHWTHDNENPPVGLILCAEKDSTVARYALEGLPNKVLATEYKLLLPKTNVLMKELRRTRNRIERRLKK